MSNGAKSFNHPDAYRVKLDGAPAALEKLQQQIAMLEVTAMLRRAEGQSFQEEANQLLQHWQQVANLANMVLETGEFGKSGYFDPDEADTTPSPLVAETAQVDAQPVRRLSEDEQKALISRYTQWEDQLIALKGRFFSDEDVLENSLEELGLESFFETRTPADISYRFCTVLWPHAENAGEWVEAVELELQPQGSGILVSDAFFPQK